MIIDQADIERKTQTKDQIIHFFDFFAFSSSHQEKIYINQLAINAKTAKTATICINSETTESISLAQILLSKLVGGSGFVNEVSLHQGSHAQLTGGAEE